MKLKKLFALLLCVACFSTLFVSCAEEDSNDLWLNKYEEMGKGQDELIAPMTIDFYIIKGANMSENPAVSNSVQEKINQYFEATYSTTLNIKYYTAEEYFDVISGLGEDASGIVLINSEAVADVLDGRLADLYPFIHGEEYKAKDYGKLNTQISTSLMDAAVVSERGLDKLYMIPNNHVIGSYEILIVNRELTLEVGVPYSKSQFDELTTWESTLDIREAAAAAKGIDVNANSEVDYQDYVFNPTAYVTRIVNVPYAAIEELKRDSDDINVNISKYPVADKAEVCSSAFAVLNSAPKNEKGESHNLEDYKERAMRIIYEINANEDVRNLLQYGVENINYEISTETGYVVPKPENVYHMDLIYTGDVFMALHNEHWTELDRANGLAQNKDSEK